MGCGGVKGRKIIGELGNRIVRKNDSRESGTEQSFAGLFQMIKNNNNNGC